MTDSLIKTEFDRALRRPPVPRRYTTGETTLANLGIISFLLLATTLGMAETDLVKAEDRPAWRAWGAPVGMFQWWKVFAPNLRPVNWYSCALIDFADGTSKNFEFPRAGLMPLSEAFAKSPQRVFFDEEMPNLNRRQALPSVARFLARANFDKTNKPVRVTFVIHSADIPKPDPSHWVYRDQLPHHTFSQIFFVYNVSAEDFADLK